MKRYAVIYEKAGANGSAYSPDVPGCIASAPTRKAIETQFREALEFHIEGLQSAGLPIPEPTETRYISVAA